MSLYSREYFTLARSRLRDGGVVTYWLPVYQLEPREMRAIVGASAPCSKTARSGADT